MTDFDELVEWYQAQPKPLRLKPTQWKKPEITRRETSREIYVPVYERLLDNRSLYNLGNGARWIRPRHNG